MKHQEFFSDTAWFMAFTEQPIWIDYALLMHNEIDAPAQMLFVFKDHVHGSETNCATLYLVHIPNTGATSIRLSVDSLPCRREDYAERIARGDPFGAINIFLNLTILMREYVLETFEKARHRGDLDKGNLAFNFQKKHFPFLEAEVKRLREIQSERREQNRAATS